MLGEAGCEAGGPGRGGFRAGGRVRGFSERRGESLVAVVDSGLAGWMGRVGWADAERCVCRWILFRGHEKKKV